MIVNPVEVAHHARQEFCNKARRQPVGSRQFLPERILHIDGNRSSGRSRRYLRTNLTVKVRWTGYSEQWDTWEPYQELKHTQAFKEYCEKHKLQYLLDSSQRQNT